MPEAFYKEIKAPAPGHGSVKHSTSMNPRKQPHNQPENDEDEEDYDNDSELITDPNERKLLSEKKLEKREREEYKNSFLTKFIQKTDLFGDEDDKSRSNKT